MIFEVKDEKILEKIRPLFNDIRFYMGHCVFDGTMGCAYVDDLDNPQVAFLQVKWFVFVSGTISKEKLKNIIDKNFKENIIVPSDNIAKLIEEIDWKCLKKSFRYSIKKDVTFDVCLLREMAQNINSKFSIVAIDKDFAKQINDEGYFYITDNFEKNGVGFCCIYNSQIIGVASSNIFYKDGIEINIKVKEAFRKQGIALALVANLILECLKQSKKVSWDAATTISVALAKKLGFKYDSAYRIYEFKEEYE